MKAIGADLKAPFQRRDLITILAYVKRTGRSQRCVDGSFNPESQLDRLAAAAGMQ